MEKIEKLREIIEVKIASKDITQTALAKETGVDQASISRFCKHGHGLSAENFLKLSKWAGWKMVAIDNDLPARFPAGFFPPFTGQKIFNILLAKTQNKY